jgi:hypothetical protein
MSMMGLASKLRITPSVAIEQRVWICIQPRR